MSVSHFEDFPAGRVVEHGPRLVTREEIIAFAAEFDPQPFHLDEEAARDTLVGGLCASGWHTCAILMRMMFDAFLEHSSSLGAPGVEEVKWLRPLRPGDRVTMRAEALEARVSKSRPEMGLVRFRIDLRNASGELVAQQTHTQLFGRRAAGEAA
jgi:acyl dehydratase